MARAARGYCESRSDRSRFATNAEGNGNGWSNNCQITSPMLSDWHPCAFLFESVTTESPAIQTPNFMHFVRVASSPSPALDKRKPTTTSLVRQINIKNHYFLATLETRKKAPPGSFSQEKRDIYTTYVCTYVLVPFRLQLVVLQPECEKHYSLPIGN
jgi:hypothetical protein